MPTATGVRAGFLIGVMPANDDRQVSIGRFGPDFDKINDWLRTYISQPAADLGRDGPICPFVPPALKANAIQFTFRYDVDAGTEAGIRDALHAEMADFDTVAEPVGGSGSSLESRIVVLPLADHRGWQRIDSAYESLKNTAVANGLMLGQFHPDCDERAVRNPAFPVSRSPLALFAMRRMAPHDVLFLHDRPDWFAAYHKRFHSHFERGRIRDAMMISLYHKAMQESEHNDR
jgi:hypothetical protein